MTEALEHALRALEHRERSVAEVDAYLARRGVEADERDEVIETLVRTALVDDVRYARARASALARRGAGNDLIVHELEAAGIDGETATDAVASLPPEMDRANGVVARRGASEKTARYLAGKGFSSDVVHAVVARSRDESLG